MNKIIDGIQIAHAITDDITRKTDKLKKAGVTLKLAVILVGNDKASLSFIKKKKQLAGRVGIDFELHHLSEETSQEEVIESINTVQADSAVTSVIVQLPLPKHINKRAVLEAVAPEKDVDCLTSANLGKLTAGMPFIIPPTAGAIMEIIKRENIETAGKHIVVIGRGELVGKPISIILSQNSATLSVCNRQTPDLSEFTLKADIIISGTGVPHLVKKEMVKKEVIIIDAGTSFKGKKLLGDVDFDNVRQIASKITPVPGGVGPITVAKLLENCVTLYEDIHSDVI